MCIDHSVGLHGANHRFDVVIVQALLSLNRPPSVSPLTIDGVAGGETVDAISEFQWRVMNNKKPDGRVDPGTTGRTLGALQAGLPNFPGDGSVLERTLRGIMPNADPSRLRLYAPFLRTAMCNRQINTPLRRAHFLAQLGHESDSFKYTEEVASGAAYEGRLDLGNTQPGDGTRFKGRGLIQLTGRTNYTDYGNDIHRNLTDGNNPALVATLPDLAVDVAGWFWSTKNLNSLADADSIQSITQVVNGGLNGLADRKAYLRRAKFFFRI
jgi:putative chitinase